MVVSLKYLMIAVGVLLIAGTFSFAQEKKFTADDVSKIELMALPRRVAFRKTRSQIITPSPRSPLRYLEIYESVPPDSLHVFRLNDEKGQLQRTEFFQIGHMYYRKDASDSWTVLDTSKILPVKKPDQPVPLSESLIITRSDTFLAAALAAAIEEDELIARNDPYAKGPVIKVPAPAPPSAPSENLVSVDVRFEPNKLVDRIPTDFYEVKTRGSSGSGKTQLDYVIIRRVWINKNGTLAKTEYEITNDVSHSTQLITGVYEYDPSIKIEAPIK